MTDSYLAEAAPAAASAPHWKEAADLDVEGDDLRAFAAAVIDPEVKVKLVVEHHLNDDIDAGVTLVATSPGLEDVSIDLPIGDVAAFATLLIQSMRKAVEVAEEASVADYTATLEATERERDALAQQVLLWQNRKDGEPRPDASDAVQRALAEAQVNATNLAAINACTMQPLGATGPVGPS